MNAQQIHDNYAAQLQRIEGNRTYSAHAKQVLAAKAYKTAQAQLEEARQAEVDDINRQRAALERRMFGQQGNADANTVIARRDANDRAAKLEDPQTAADALKRAQMEGDNLMAQAIAAQAAQSGWGDVLGTYAADRPGFAEYAQEYNQLPDTSDMEWNFRHTGQFIPAAPASLGTASSAEVERLAQQELEAA